MKVFIYGQGHMTKMAAMAIASTFNILLFRIRKPMSFKLCMKHQGEELYKVNHDPVMTLTYFTATVKMPFEGGGVEYRQWTDDLRF